MTDFYPWYVSFLQDPKTNLYSLTFAKNKQQHPKFFSAEACTQKVLFEEIRWLMDKLNTRSRFPEFKNRPITLWEIGSPNYDSNIDILLDPNLISFSPELIKFIQDYLWIERFGDHDFTLNLLKNLPSTEIDTPDLLEGL